MPFSRRSLLPARLPHLVIAGAVLTTCLVAAPAMAADADALPGATLSTTSADVAGPLDDITDDAEAALADALTALEDADAVTADITASGLDVDIDPIDTTALETRIDAFANLDVTPALMLPDLTEDAAAETLRVEQATDDAQAALEDAQEERKAEEEGAKDAAQAGVDGATAAAAEAEEAAAEAEEEAAAEALASANTVEGAQATAESLASSEYGWGSDQFSCLVSLWDRESGWNYQASNASSGAFGIPQALPGSKMATAGSDWATSATTQIEWGLAYIAAAYGTPCGAWSHSESVGWY